MSDVDYEYPPEWTPRGMETPVRRPDPDDIAGRIARGELKSGCPDPMQGKRGSETDYPSNWTP